MNFSTFTKQLAGASSNSIATSQSGSAGVPLTLTASPVTIDTATAANSAIGRRVVLAYGGSDTSFMIVGTNSNGNTVTDVAVGASGAAQSNLDFVTVSSITPVGGGSTGVTAGTNGVGSSPWWLVNQMLTPINISAAVELVSGSANFTIQYTYDDPNNLLAGIAYPLDFNSAVLNGATATADGAFSIPIAALRLLINSGTGALRVRYLQAGIG